MPDLNGSLSFCTDRQMRQSLSRSEKLTASPTPWVDETPLPCWDSPACTGSRFPAPAAETDCPASPPSYNGKLRHEKTNFFCYPHKSEGRAGFCARTQFSHLSPSPATSSCQTSPQTIPIRGESGAGLHTPNNFPGDMGGIRVLKGELATFLNHTNLLFLWKVSEPFSSPFFFSLLQLLKKPGHLFRQTIGGTASPR